MLYENSDCSCTGKLDQIILYTLKDVANPCIMVMLYQFFVFPGEGMSRVVPLA